MTKDEFIESIRGLYKDGIETIKLKNQDYATADNPFRNFEIASVANIDAKSAILVRVLDKIARISNLLNRKNPAVTDEKIEDSIKDAVNLLAILYARIESEKPKEGQLSAEPIRGGVVRQGPDTIDSQTLDVGSVGADVLRTGETREDSGRVFLRRIVK